MRIGLAVVLVSALGGCVHIGERRPPLVIDPFLLKPCVMSAGVTQDQYRAMRPEEQKRFLNDLAQRAAKQLNTCNRKLVTIDKIVNEYNESLK